MTSPELPPALRTAVSQEIDRDRKGLRAGTAALTRAYKDGGRSAETMDFTAYLAARLPATYAAVTRALSAVVDHIPGFAPASLVDVGSGPGTASWAAAECFPTLTGITFLDNNRPFLDLALRLALAADHPALRGAVGVQGDMAALTVTADLVVSAYALAELPESRAAVVACTLWDRTAQVLVLVEPGTPAGFARIRAARTVLMAMGAAIAAPCPQAGDCPLTGSDWCHFSVRLSRSRAHMQAKGATVPFEDERFAYLVASRLPIAPTAARILSPTSVGKPGVALRLCTPEGVVNRVVAKREGEPFKRAKKAGWGDSWT